MRRPLIGVLAWLVAVVSCVLAVPSSAWAQTIVPAGSSPAEGAQLALAGVTPSTCRVQSGTYADFPNGSGPRGWIVVLPPGGATPATPMVISIHGAWSSALAQQEVTGFSVADPQQPASEDAAASVAMQADTTTLGQREGFIAVFPQARSERQRVWDAAPGSVDQQFVIDLTQYLHDQGCSSPAVTTLTGFSMGAMMTSRLLCTRPDLYSGGAMVGGVLSPLDPCPLPDTTKIVVVHGLVDTIVPWDGSLADDLASYAGPGSQSTLNRGQMAVQWARAKDCPSPGWTTWRENTVTDLGCPTSPTFSVLGWHQAHTWDGWGMSTSAFIWEVMRPDQACTFQPAGPDSPELAAALSDRFSRDMVFRVAFSRTLLRQAKCNPWLQAKLVAALQADIKADPNGETAQKMVFAFRELLRKPPR